MLNQLGQNPEDQYLADYQNQIANGSKPIQYVPPTQQEQPMSETGVGGLQSGFNKLIDKDSNSTGLGSLVSGIGALFLAPKVRKAQAGAEANRLRMQGLEADKQDLANQTQRQQLELEKPKIEQQKGMNALSNIQLGLSQNIAEDIKTAKGELNENGTAKNFFQKFMEQSAQGKYAGIDLRKLAIFDPSIVSLGSQVYSQYTQDAFNAALNNAAKLQQKHQENLMEVQRAAISKGESELDAWKAWGGLLNDYGKGMAALADYSLDPAIRNDMLENMGPVAKAINKMGLRYGLINKETMLNPNGAAQNIMNGDQQSFIDHLTSVKGMMDMGNQMATKPQNSPDRVKTKEAPLQVGTTTPPVNQKALQVLGE